MSVGAEGDGVVRIQTDAQRSMRLVHACKHLGSDAVGDHEAIHQWQCCRRRHWLEGSSRAREIHWLQGARVYIEASLPFVSRGSRMVDGSESRSR